MLLGQLQHLLHQRLVQIDLQHRRVGARKDLVALFVQQVDQRQHVRALGDGARHVAVVVKHGQPGAHAVRDGHHIVAVDLVIFQLLHHGRAHRRVVHDAQVRRPELDVGDVLHHVARHAAVDVLHPAHVAPVGDVIVLREALDIHECRADYHDAHQLTLLCNDEFFCTSMHSSYHILRCFQTSFTQIASMISSMSPRSTRSARLSACMLSRLMTAILRLPPRK